MDDEALFAESDHNLITASVAMFNPRGAPPERVRHFGPVTALLTGVERYNPIFAFDPRAGARDLRAAIDWSRSNGAQPSIEIRASLDPVLGTVARELGLSADPWRTPAMALDPIPDEIPAGPADLEIHELAGSDAIATWHLVWGTSPAMQAAYTESIEAIDRARILIGFIDGRAVSSAIAYGTADSVGLYGIATLPDAQRRGYGRAVTWAAIETARRAWAVSTAVLQSTDQGVPLYRSMGFRVVGEYVEFATPEA